MRGALAILLVSGCGSESEPPAEPPPAKDAGAACAVGELTLEGGGCQPAGVPPDACAPGFTAEAEGCVPVLPAAACEKGKMAVPGEASCRDVSACGDGTWGDIPVDASTQFVDAAYVGGGSDGSMTKPWTTIQEGVDASAPGGLVAVAKGTYPEIVLISKRPVRLAGRCPSLVTIHGPKAAAPGLDIRTGAEGAVVTGVGVTSAGYGVLLSGSEEVTLERVWIHDTAERPINLQNDLGPSGIALRGSLVEGGLLAGVIALGGVVTVEGSVIRAVAPDVDETAGRGIDVEWDGKPSTLVVSGSVIEDCHDAGIFVSGSSLELSASVVRGTKVEVSDGLAGLGVLLQDEPTGPRATATIKGSVLSGNHDTGLGVIGSDATVEALVVRGTEPDGDQAFGRGIAVADDVGTGQRGNIDLRTSLVEANHDGGVVIGGSDASLSSVRIRGTLPRPDGRWGRGLQIQGDLDSAATSTVTVTASVVEESTEVGVSVVGSVATFDNVEIRATAASANAGEFGDGLFVVAEGHDASAVVQGCRIAENARAGVSSFGGSVTLTGTELDCNQIDIDGEVYATSGMIPPSFTDAGGNICGCGDTEVSCKMLSSGLVPPEPIAQ